MVKFALPKKMRVFLYTFFATLLLFSSSCKKNVVEPAVDVSSWYLPLNLDYTWTYQMDSIVFNGTLNPPDTFSFEIRNEVVNILPGPNNEVSYIMERSNRSSSSSPFTFVRSFSESLGTGYALRQDFNSTLIIHDFPVVQYKEWDGNLYNTNDEIDSYYSEIHANFQNDDLQFDSTCTVIHDEAINAVQSFYELETFAKNIGLVYKEFEHLENLGSPQLKGVKYTMTLKSFEK